MRIIIAVDGSDCSNTAVEFVTSQLWKAGDEFTILHVVEPLPVECGLGVVRDESVASEDYVVATELVSKTGLTLKNKLPDAKVEAKVTTGFVVEQICQWATDWNADLIVLGSHGRKGFEHFVLGSVAEEVMKKAPCTVEIVKQKREMDTSKAAKKTKGEEKAGAVSAKSNF